MGNGISRVLPCFTPSKTSFPNHHEAIFSGPLDEALGHSFCYIRPPLPGSTSQRFSASNSQTFSPSNSQRFCSQEEEKEEEDPKTRSGGFTETTFRSISGASVSANTSTPRTTSLLNENQLQNQAKSLSHGSINQNHNFWVTGFESTSSFSALPLQPVPRLEHQNPEMCFSGNVDRSFMSGILERGFMSGPLERGTVSGPLDNNDGIHFSAPLGGLYLKKKGFSSARRKGLSSVRKAFQRSISERQRPWVVPVLNFVGLQPFRKCYSGKENGPNINDPNIYMGFNTDLENENLQWAHGKAGEDRVHVVVSEEHGWLFIGIYDGFNGPDAPDFLLGNLYKAVFNELEGLLWNRQEEIADGVVENVLVEGKEPNPNLNTDKRNSERESTVTDVDEEKNSIATGGDRADDLVAGMASSEVIEVQSSIVPSNDLNPTSDFHKVDRERNSNLLVNEFDEKRNMTAIGANQKNYLLSTTPTCRKVYNGFEKSNELVEERELAGYGNTEQRSHRKMQEDRENAVCGSGGLGESGEPISLPHSGSLAKRVTFELQKPDESNIRKGRPLRELLAEEDEDGFEIWGSNRFTFSLDNIFMRHKRASNASTKTASYLEREGMSQEDMREKYKSSIRRARGRSMLFSRLKHGYANHKENRRKLFPWGHDWDKEKVEVEIGEERPKKTHRRCRSGQIDHDSILKALEQALEATEVAYLEMTDKFLDENPELALMGSCLLVMLMKDEDVYIMNVGDSRAIVAQYQPETKSCNRVTKEQEGHVIELEGIVEEAPESSERNENLGNDASPAAPMKLTALQLSTDHSTSIEEEVLRIKEEHPDDSECIVNDRVKGRLKVTRAFGAGFLKQPKLNNALLEMFRNEYIGSAPYISCSPSLRHHRLGPNDQFLVLSSDGLYQYLSNEEVVSHVENFMEKFPDGDPAQYLIEELLFRAAKKAGMGFHELLDIPQGDRRKYHDDVTVMVISLEGRIWKSSGKYI
ncbi:hypothetical protein AMTRI_Chr13g115370 [Amborella trichopoda]